MRVGVSAVAPSQRLDVGGGTGGGEVMAGEESVAEETAAAAAVAAVCAAFAAALVAVACCACWQRAVDVTTELVLRVLYYTMAAPLVCWITWQ